MKVILRHSRTGLLLKDIGEWTASVDEALDLGTVIQAVETACVDGSPELEILFLFGDPALDVVFPIWGKAAQSAKARDGISETDAASGEQHGGYDAEEGGL